jgi:clan AA aspartic protease (TIGR02281 family)
MTRLSSSFVRDRELILVEAEVVGPTGRTIEARLVLDTGAAATMLTPSVTEKVGYTRRDRFKTAKVHTAIGEERGYWLRVAEFTVLGVTTLNFALTVFPLGHNDIDGLVGMNFLRHFNFEVRQADRQILLELVDGAHGAGPERADGHPKR